MYWPRWAKRRVLLVQLLGSYRTGDNARPKLRPNSLRMLINMTPAEIIENAASMGVLLYLELGKIRYFGALPTNWVEVTEKWLDQRDKVIEYLANAPWAHRVRLAKAAAEMSRRQSLPCIHLGPLIEAKPACGCGPRHHCSRHGECVLSGATNRWRVCSRCPDYSSGVG